MALTSMSAPRRRKRSRCVRVAAHLSLPGLTAPSIARTSAPAPGVVGGSESPRPRKTMRWLAEGGAARRGCVTLLDAPDPPWGRQGLGRKEGVT